MCGCPGRPPTLGVPVGPAVPDAEHEIGFEHGRVAIAVEVCNPTMPASADDHRESPPAHQRRDDRDIQRFRKLDQQLRCVGMMIPPPATISGRSAATSMSSALAICAWLAAGL